MSSLTLLQSLHESLSTRAQVTSVFGEPDRRGRQDNYSRGQDRLWLRRRDRQWRTGDQDRPRRGWRGRRWSWRSSGGRVRSRSAGHSLRRGGGQEEAALGRCCWARRSACSSRGAKEGRGSQCHPEGSHPFAVRMAGGVEGPLSSHVPVRAEIRCARSRSGSFDCLAAWRREAATPLGMTILLTYLDQQARDVIMLRRRAHKRIYVVHHASQHFVGSGSRAGV